MTQTAKRLNYSAAIDADVFCPRCLGPMLYIGAGEKACPEHGEGKAVNIFEALALLRDGKGSR